MNETTSTNIHYYVTPKFMSSARGGHMIRTRLYFIWISSNNNNQKQKQKQKIKIRKANRCRHHHPKRNTETQRRATLRQTSDSLQQLILLKRHWNILSFFILFSNFLFHVDWKLSFCSGREKKKRNASVNAKTNEEKKICPCPCPHKCSVPLRRGEIHSGSWIYTQSVQCHHFSDLDISLAAPGCVLGFHAEFCRRVVGHFSFWEGWFFSDPLKIE